MKKNLIITLTGHDRVGLVEHVTKIVIEQHGNVEASKMAHLGGEFAMMMHVTVDEANVEAIEVELEKLRKEGDHITACETQMESPKKYRGWLPFQVEVSGADHEGIIHRMTSHMAEYGINIETMDTNNVIAPVSGTPLFTMYAIVLAPPDLNLHEWQSTLIALGSELNVETEIFPYKG